ncbi:MAG: DUF6702 family protein [Ferruginibacter sp.]
MAIKFYKWLFFLASCMALASFGRHPIYISVTEIEHNAKERTLEISCKLFTDDFEKTLRNAYKVHIDLLNPKDKAAMDKLVNDYVQKHFRITVDGKPVALKYLGYEQIEEGIYSYYQADNVAAVKSVTITNNLLYEYKTEQMGLMHVTVNGERKSTRLNNPEEKAVLSF